MQSPWKLQRGIISPCYTTRLSDVQTARA
ncbi:DUF4113 domain-containing protein [Cronobacter sakazakii]